MTDRRLPAPALFLAAAIALVVAASTLFVVLQPGLSGTRPEPGLSNPPVGTGALDRELASMLLGIRPEDVVYTEDGALGVTYDGVQLELILLRPIDESRAERLVLAAQALDIAEARRQQQIRGVQTPVVGGETVLCPAEVGLIRSSYVFGYRLLPGAVTLEVETGALTERAEATGEGEAEMRPLLGLEPIGGEASTGTFLFAVAPPAPDVSQSLTLLFTPPANAGRRPSVAVGLTFPDGRNPRTVTPAGCWTY